MKKIILSLVVCILMASLVLAQGQQGVHEPGIGIEDPEIKEAGQGTGQGLEQDAGQGEKALVQGQVQERNEEGMMIQQRVRAKDSAELGQIIQQRQQQMNQELQGLGKNRQKVYQNQNKVRLAVHSLLAMEDIVGGIGPQVREIARNFNNSVQATVRAEESIQTRRGFVRFFVGGDEEAAEELDQEVQQNQQRIQELKQLREQCDCDEEVKAMMQEQVQSMEQEQTRLQQLAQAEKKSKGLFGWLWK